MNTIIKTILTIVIVTWAQTGFSQDPPETTHDGLVLIPDSKADIAYKLPEADLSGYNKVVILEPLIAFRKDWQKDQNRNTRSSGGRVGDGDMERMISRGKGLFIDAFTDVLEDGGYEVVSGAGEDVLLVRPAIINLDVAAPDLNTAGRNRTYVASAIAATIYVELFDSVTSQIIARASDSRVARSNSSSWSMNMGGSSIENRQLASRTIKYWAGLLKDALDEARAQ